MYEQFFGLKQEPFSIAPDPRFLFMSERHREALAHLLYGVDGGGGFVLLTGEIGAGKTTVCRCFLEQIPRRTNVAYIFNPKLTVTELLQSVCDEFRIPFEHRGPGPATVKDYIDPLNEFLLKTHAVGQNNVLIIDEAQNLSAEVLEQLRLLTNLETNERKLLQIILIGQPELRTMLARPELEQLAQRVIARYHLDALTEVETGQYIRHRLAVAGRTGVMPISREARKRIHQLARGVPRRINLLCDRALLGAYADGKARVETDIVDKAAREVFDQAPALTANPARYWRLGGVALAALAAVLGVAALLVDGGAERRKAALGTAVRGAAEPASAPASAAVAESAASAGVSAGSPASAASGASAVSAAGVVAAGTAAASAADDARLRFALPIRTEQNAWRELAPMWKLPPGDGDPCQAAQRSGVECFRRSDGSLALIRLLGRPGILTLRGENDQRAYAVLTGLTNQSATLRMAGVSQTVPLAALAKVWRGDFATLWRVPPGPHGPGKGVGDGPASAWLAGQLSKVDGPAPLGGSPASELPLKARVQAFQLAHGLAADGVAGPTTLMQLNRATGVDEPRLDTGS